MYKNSIPHLIKDEDFARAPQLIYYLPTKKGDPPLARATNWKYKMVLNMNTQQCLAGLVPLGILLDILDPHNATKFVGDKEIKYWGNVDLYWWRGTRNRSLTILSILDKVHTIMLIDFSEEPFKKIINQGMILGESSFVYRIKGKNTFGCL